MAAADDAGPVANLAEVMSTLLQDDTTRETQG
jgi:hypothetical protein